MWFGSYTRLLPDDLVRIRKRGLATGRETIALLDMIDRLTGEIELLDGKNYELERLIEYFRQGEKGN